MPLLSHAVYTHLVMALAGLSVGVAYAAVDDASMTSMMRAPSGHGHSHAKHREHHQRRQLPEDPSISQSSMNCRAAPPKRVVFSLTTTALRLPRIKPALDSVISEQAKRPDAVYLSVGPEVKDLPEWLETDMREGPGRGVLKVLRHPRDLGPGMKLLGGLREELAAGHNYSLVVWGDDDQIYGPNLLELHAERHRCLSGGQRKAFGGRAINAGKPSISILEATGGISMYAGHVPEEAFKIAESPDVCKYSDDYFFARALNSSGVQLEVMKECDMNWATGRMSSRCVRKGLSDVAHTHALSDLQLGKHGKSFHGDWRSQLRRYEECGQALVGGA